MSALVRFRASAGPHPVAIDVQKQACALRAASKARPRRTLCVGTPFRLMSCAAGSEKRRCRLRIQARFRWTSSLMTPVQSCRKKYCSFVFPENVVVYAYPASCRGTYASSRYVEVGCDGRDGCARRAQSGADGEVVWSWPLDAEVCATRQRRVVAKWGQERRSPGRARRTPLKPSRGEGRDVPAEPVVPAACILCCRRAMGAAGSRPSSRPLVRGR